MIMFRKIFSLCLLLLLFASTHIHADDLDDEDGPSSSVTTSPSSQPVIDSNADVALNPASSSAATVDTETTSNKVNSTKKNFTIDWNEVERNWERTLSEEEVAQKWKEMETGMKNGVRAVLRTIFPQVVAMSSDAKVSGNCSAGILKWIVSLRHLKGWAVKSKSHDDSQHDHKQISCVYQKCRFPSFFPFIDSHENLSHVSPAVCEFHSYLLKAVTE